MRPAFNELRAMGQNLMVMRDFEKSEDSGNPATQAVTVRHESVAASSLTHAPSFANALERPSPIEIKMLLVPSIHLDV
jgi:hypothetical protein